MGHTCYMVAWSCAYTDVPVVAGTQADQNGHAAETAQAPQKALTIGLLDPVSDFRAMIADLNDFVSAVQCIVRCMATAFLLLD